MKNPKVSICLPNLNSRPFLEERMESLVNQTMTDWEMIISDNYSDDGSWEYFGKFRDDKRICMFQSPKGGMYDNWNNCLRQAVGEYVYVATSDDASSPDMLEKMVAALDANPDVDLCACDFDETDEEGRVIEPFLEPEVEFLGDWMKTAHRRSRYAEFLIQMCLGCHWKTITAVLIRRTLFEKTGLFRTDCLSYADTPWRTKAALHSDLIYVPEKLATWRRHKAQATANLPTNREELIWNAIRKAVYESAYFLPKEWREAGDEHIEKILFGRRRRYCMDFHLNRKAMKEHPFQFAGGLMKAAVKDRGYLAERVKEKFSWESRWYCDMDRYMLDLFEKWNVPWPPEKIK